MHGKRTLTDELNPKFGSLFRLTDHKFNIRFLSYFKKFNTNDLKPSLLFVFSASEVDIRKPASGSDLDHCCFFIQI